MGRRRKPRGGGNYKLYEWLKQRDGREGGGGGALEGPLG